MRRIGDHHEPSRLQREGLENPFFDAEAGVSPPPHFDYHLRHFETPSTNTNIREQARPGPRRKNSKGPPLSSNRSRIALMLISTSAVLFFFISWRILSALPQEGSLEEIYDNSLQRLDLSEAAHLRKETSLLYSEIPTLLELLIDTVKAKNGSPSSPLSQNKPLQGSLSITPSSQISILDSEKPADKLMGGEKRVKSESVKINLKEDLSDRNAANEGGINKNAATAKEKEGELAGSGNIQTGLCSSANKMRNKHITEKIYMATTPCFYTPRQTKVVEAMRWAWNEGYVKYAWGSDELAPLSKRGKSWNGYNIGLTIIDSLDTLYLMGLREEFAAARQWCAKHLTFDVDVPVNLFETTIRILGGLLSTYTMTGDDLLYNLAQDIGSRLLGAFTSSSPVPFSDVNLRTRVGTRPDFTPFSSTAEVSTIQLEFRLLTELSGKREYDKKARAVSDHLAQLPKDNGLVPIFISPDSGQFSSTSTLSFGARGDSYYEYLLKQWLLTGKNDKVLRDRYVEAMKGMISLLLQKSKKGIVYIAEKFTTGLNHKMDHLVCFMPGLLALGAHHGIDDSHWKIAEDLMETCYKMYEVTASKLAPEIIYIDAAGDIDIHSLDAYNIGRPETVESLFILYRLTGNEKYRQWGWNIFEAFNKHLRVPSGGFASVDHVTSSSPTFQDSMQSFFLAETLKYLFLLFDDNPLLLPLEEYVLNTEAHPLPIDVASILRKGGS